MGNSKFSDDFKRDAVHQIAVRGCPASGVLQRLEANT
jgi:transposase-like protein